MINVDFIIQCQNLLYTLIDLYRKYTSNSKMFNSRLYWDFVNQKLTVKPKSIRSKNKINCMTTNSYIDLPKVEYIRKPIDPDITID